MGTKGLVNETWRLILSDATRKAFLLQNGRGEEDRSFSEEEDVCLNVLRGKICMLVDDGMVRMEGGAQALVLKTFEDWGLDMHVRNVKLTVEQKRTLLFFLSYVLYAFAKDILILEDIDESVFPTVYEYYNAMLPTSTRRTG